MELISLKELPIEVKVSILNELGYSSDGVFVTDNDGRKVIDPYIQEPVRVDNMLVLPGSEVILDSNPLSIASYLEDHGDII